MIAAAVLLAQYAGTLDFLDTTRVGTRATQPPALLSDPPRKIVLALDLSTAPTARFRMADRRWSWTLSYSPVLTARDAELGLRWPSGSPQINDALLLHTGLATFGWHDRFVSVGLTEAAAYGMLNSALLYQLPAAPGQTTPLQSVPQPTTIEFGSSNTEGNIAVRLARPVVAALSGGYMVSGGLDQNILPEQYGGRAGASVAITLSRSDAVSTLANVQDLNTSGPCPPVVPSPPQPAPIALCRERTLVFQLQETLRHQLSAAATLSASAGAAVSELVEHDNGQEILVIQPVGVVALNQRLGANPAAVLTLSAQLSPTVDILTGIPSERAQLTATMANPILSSVLITFTLSAMKSAALFTSDPSSDRYLVTVLSGAIEGRVRLSPQVDLGVGLQAFWQDQENFATFSSEIGYLSVTARAPTLHF